MKGPDDYTQPCAENGVSHDCSHDYLMWWNREQFDQWLALRDDRNHRQGAREQARYNYVQNKVLSRVTTSELAYRTAYLVAGIASGLVVGAIFL